MPERVQATRTGLTLGLAYTLPLLAWLLGQSFWLNAEGVGIAYSLQGMLTTMLLLQTCMLAICLPWLLRFPAATDQCCGIAMLVLVPGPLYAICWLAGTAEAAPLAIALATVVGLALVLYGIYATCLSLTSPGQARALLLLLLQVTLVSLCWNYSHLWQQVLLL